VPVGHRLAHVVSAAYTSGWDQCLIVVNDAMGANDSIGILYSLVTLHLGFDFNSDECKIMGLAPYGDPSHFRSFFEQAVELRDLLTEQIVGVCAP
jgi:carbamoyltransferase